ncbi:MAG TPA: N,N-dimethylformamidase beta subunit family domain-containing protein, partial [Nordella sp.]|nr:N,N-dimethylformamidase beta subunit family domain-containing protein [Nordella sp.]
MLSLIAYTNTLSAAAGETIAVKVGSYGAETYRADLRRIIQSDRHPDGPGYKDEAIVLDLGGDRPARRQAIRPGSYVRIADRGDVLADLASFTLAVPVLPTLVGGTERTIFHLTGIGLELLIDREGHARARLDEADIALKAPVICKQWTLLVVSFDKGRLRLSSLTKDSEIIAQNETSATLRRTSVVTVLIAARAAGENHFDGKIDSPVLFSRSLEPVEAVARLALPQNLCRSSDLVAFWDFSRAIDGTQVIDASPHQLHGETWQCPTRAMTGWRWAGQCHDWRQIPELYSAIHFHADDMTDALWDTDFEVRLPDDLKSGLYAIRLVPDGEEAAAYHCVFAVRPPRRSSTGNTVCFLLPTASYLAYANHRLGLDVPGTEVGMGRLVEIDRHHAFLQEHPELGFSFYEVHADGSGVFHSSRNRPVVDLQPGIKGFLGGLGSNVWQFTADTHITGWLDHQGVAYDVITDEDLHRDGLALLRRYNVVLTGTHPEYHSLQMLDALQGFVDRGGRLMYLGGNGFYWRISFSDKHPGVIECRRSEAGIRPW